MTKISILVFALLSTLVFQVSGAFTAAEMDKQDVKTNFVLTIAENGIKYKPSDILLLPPFENSKPIYPSNDGTYWLRFEIENSSNKSIPFAFSFFPFDRIDCFIYSDTNSIPEHLRTGSTRSVHEKNIRHYSNTINYSVKQNAKTVIVAKLKYIQAEELYKKKIKSFYGFPTLPTEVGVSIVRKNKVENATLFNHYQFLFFLGICLSMMLFNLILFLFIGDKVYLYYVISIAAIIGYYLFYQNIGIQLFDWLTDKTSYQLKCFFASIIIWGLANFTRFFLNAPLHFPRWNLFYKFISIIGIVTTVLVVSDFFFGGLMAIYTPIINLASIIGNLSVPVFAYYAFRRKIRFALSFFYANTIYAFLNIVFLLFIMNILPPNSFTSNSMGIGFTIQTILLSMTLAERIKILREEKVMIEEQQLIAIKQLTEQKNIELQKQVYERTSELYQQNNSLNSTVSELNRQIEINTSINKELTKSNQTKDKLFSIIAHDLRSPFNTILGFSELLIKNIRNIEVEKSENYLRLINKSTKNTLILLDNLLNWAKSQTGQLSFNPQKLTLSIIIQEIIELKNSRSTIKNISLNYSPSDELEVYADADMLKAVLRNLISNAIKFTKSGGHINIYAVSKHEYVEISISDNGVGMSQDTINKLFDITTNITSTGTSHEKGSGLGLVLCKEFIEKLGGNIWVESKEGKGSDFKFTLPLYKSSV